MNEDKKWNFAAKQWAEMNQSMNMDNQVQISAKHRISKLIIQVSSKIMSENIWTLS